MPQKKNKVPLTKDHENWYKVVEYMKTGDIKEVEKKYILSDEIKKELNG